MMRSWLFLLISAAAGAQAAPPARVEIAYEISRNGSPVAEIVQQLEHDGRSYQLAETWKGKGLYMLWGVVKRSSRGAVTADGLKPLEFTDERSGRATASAKFDWKAKTITMQYRGEPRTEPLPESARDRLCFLFEFAFAPPRSSEVTLDLFDGRGRSRHTYGVDGRERLRTPAGDFDTLRLVRASDGERAEISLATDRSHLPVRILVVGRDGTRVDQVATRISAP
jgi:hypothetical protein